MSGLTTLDISNFDTNNVTNMAFMFSGNSSLTTLDVSNFVTSKVGNMRYMFNGNSSLITLDVSNFNTSNVFQMDAMFYEVSSIKELDVSNFDTSKVTTMRAMFYNVSSVEKLDVSNFNTNNVSNITEMFYGMASLKSLDVSNFNTSKVTSLKNLFYNTSSLTELDVSNFDTSKVTNMDRTFYGMSSLQSLDISNFKTSKVSTMIYTFRYTNEMKSLTLGTEFSFVGNYTLLPYPPGGDKYTGFWIKEGGDGRTWSSAELIKYYNGTRNAGTYVWQERTNTAEVSVNYVDESGVEIANSETLYGEVGAEYSAEAKAIEGYTLKETEGQTSGTFTDEVQNVKFIYTKVDEKQQASNVYRLYNTRSKEHLYTTDLNEYQTLPNLSKDWIREGVNFKAYKKAGVDTEAIYRVYNPKSGEHVFTRDANEVTELTTKHGWKSENTAFYTPKSEGKAVYRLFNAKAGIGAHFYTSSSNEKRVLTTQRGWTDEGIAWYSVE